MIEIENSDPFLVLKYSSDFQSTDWIDEKLESNDWLAILRVFRLNKTHFLKKTNDIYGQEYHFKIAVLEGQYYKIDNSVLGLNNNFFFHKKLSLREEFFVAKTKVSLLKIIDQNINEPIYIGGDKENMLPFEEFKKLVRKFPTTHELNLYRGARVTAIINNYFDTVKYKEEVYKSYINQKTIDKDSDLRSMFKYSELEKYSTLLERLKVMLNSENHYSEKNWQLEILPMILLLYPKYIKAIPEVSFKDIYSGKTRRLDFGLIDFMGNLDLIEIKIPFGKSIVSNSRYRDNHIPTRELSGAIMQVEKYIYYLNKLGKNGEQKLNDKYRSELPNNLNIKIVNPSAIIIMGRNQDLDETQLEDFEIIKRKYKNVVDIFTYDDLIQRLEMMIIQLKKL